MSESHLSKNWATGSLPWSHVETHSIQLIRIVFSCIPESLSIDLRGLGVFPERTRLTFPVPYPHVAAWVSVSVRPCFHVNRDQSHPQSQPAGSTILQVLSKDMTGRRVPWLKEKLQRELCPKRTPEYPKRTDRIRTQTTKIFGWTLQASCKGKSPGHETAGTICLILR